MRKSKRVEKKTDKSISNKNNVLYSYYYYKSKVSFLQH